MVSVIIIQYKNYELTKEAIKTFQKFHKEDIEIFLVDNGSGDFSEKEFLDEFPELVIIPLKSNLGFSKANNYAASLSRGEWLFFLNNDVVITEEILSPIQSKFVSDDEIGLIGIKLLNQDGSYQLSHGKFPSFFRELIDKIIYSSFDKDKSVLKKYLITKYSESQDTEWVTGAALFIRKGLFDKIGGFDENIFMYFEDKDLCKKVKDSGKRVYYLSDVSLIHIKGGSSKGEVSKFTQRVYRESQRYFYKKYRNKIENLLLSLYLKFINTK